MRTSGAHLLKLGPGAISVNALASLEFAKGVALIVYQDDGV
jgi:hypothetical protein